MLDFLKKYNTQQEKAFLALAIIALCQETLFIYPVAALSHIGPFSGLSKLILPASYFILFLISIRGLIIAKYVRPQDFLLLLFFAVYTLISYNLSFEQSIAISETFVSEILPCLPFFFIGLCLKIDKVSFDALGKWSCLAVILTSFYRIFYQNPEEAWDYDYNMGAAYALLANIMITIVYVYHAENKILPIVSILIGAFYLLGMGTRGPFLTMLTILLLSFFLYSKIQLWKKVLIGAILGTIGLLLSISTIFGHLGWLNNILSSLGLSTRIFDIGLDNEMISDTSGRDDIYLLMLREMDNMPLFGYGVLGERQFDVMAHHFYLQALFNYGYLFGGLIILYILTIALKSFFKATGKITQKWLLVWMVYVFIRGFFGGGVLRFDVFILIGSCLRVLRAQDSDVY